MKRIFNIIPLLIALLFLNSCGDKDKNVTAQPTEKDKILINYPWKMTEVTDLSGKTIAKDKLDLKTQIIPLLEIQFVSGNKVYAKDEQSQVQNGGTWYLTNETKILDIDIISFKGQFGIEELTNSKMRLKSKMPISGVEQDAIMVFAPVIK